MLETRGLGLVLLKNVILTVRLLKRKRLVTGGFDDNFFEEPLLLGRGILCEQLVE
jgi:hypothetical protein